MKPLHRVSANYTFWRYSISQYLTWHKVQDIEYRKLLPLGFGLCWDGFNSIPWPDPKILEEFDIDVVKA